MEKCTGKSQASFSWLLCPLVFLIHSLHVHFSHFSNIRLFVASWTVAYQPPLSMEFSRQEHWSGFPCPPPGDLPDPGIEPRSPVSPALAGGFFTVEPPGKPLSQLRWLQTHEIDIGAIHRDYSDVTSSIFTCMCVHVCVALCKTCVCVALQNHHHSSDTVTSPWDPFMLPSLPTPICPSLTPGNH